MDLQNVKNLTIPEGSVKTIHDKDSRLLWGAVGYDTKYAGDTTQQTYSGKNLFSFSSISTVGCTYTENNGVYAITATANSPTLRFILEKTITAGTYALSGPATLPSGTSISFRNANNGGVGTLGPSTYNTTGVITTTGDAYSISFFTNIQTGGTMTLDLSKFMVEAGSSRTSYEPYCGGIPAPNPSFPMLVNVATGTQTVTVIGKNLFNKDSGDTLNTVVDASGIGSNAPNTFCTVFARCQPNTTYTVSKAFDSTKNRFAVAYTKTLPTYNMSEVYGRISGSTKSALTITTGADAKYIVAYVWITGGSVSADDMVASVQIEEGNQASSFEPYQGHDYTVNLGSIELCKIGTYQDYIYKSGDDWYMHKESKKTIYSGSENWELRDGKSHTFQIPISLARQGLSNYFTSIASSGFDVVSGMYASNSSVLIISYPDMADLSAFTTWLETHNLVFYQVLSNPLADTQITDATLISQLDAIHQFLTRYGYNATVSGNLPIIIDRTAL